MSITTESNYLDIHILSQNQFENAREANALSEEALYVTPADFTIFAPLESPSFNGVPLAYDIGSTNTKSRIVTKNYVDNLSDILKYNRSTENFPTTGNNSKIYLDTATNKIYHWNGSTYVEISPEIKTGTVQNVQVQATAPLVSSNANQQTTALNTTISLSTGYGDTQNPYTSKTKGYVLAAPANENGLPTFRALTKSDIGLNNVTNNEQVTKATFTAANQILYSSAANTPAILAPNTTATRKFLRMVGNGTNATAPVWDTITKADLGLENVNNTADSNKIVAQAATLTNLTSTVAQLNLLNDMTGNNSVQTRINAKQDTLVNETNIKSIKSGTASAISILGSGNVQLKTINSYPITGSGDIAVQATLINETNIKSIKSGSGTGTSLLGSGSLNLKTINGNSIVGSGNIEIQAGNGLPNLTNSSSNKSVYVVGYDSTTGAQELDYNSAVYFNPSTGYLTATKVYNAVWNDYAEWFEKENLDENFEPGDICIWNNTGVTKYHDLNDPCVIGIVSDTYGHILGGEKLDDMEDNHKKFVPIGMKGRIKAKIIGKVNKGDLIVTSNIPGHGRVDNTASQNQVLGKALESSYKEESKLITILI